LIYDKYHSIFVFLISNSIYQSKRYSCNDRELKMNEEIFSFKSCFVLLIKIYKYWVNEIFRYCIAFFLFFELSKWQNRLYENHFFSKTSIYIRIFRYLFLSNYAWENSQLTWLFTEEIISIKLVHLKGAGNDFYLKQKYLEIISVTIQ
jgi:hypothetical protein